MLFEIKLFVFVFCILVMLKNIFVIAKVMYMKEGKVHYNTPHAIGVGLAMAYVITILISGFN